MYERNTFRIACATLVAVLVSQSAWTLRAEESKADPKPPKVGETAKDFTLDSIAGKSVKLSELTDQGPVILLVLRGYPGYQCPICTRQVGEYLRHAKKFEEAGATVVMIYPGPADNLKKYADEFVKNQVFPKHFQMLIDPGYKFTNAYGLRWDAPRETAYPSTFVVDEDRKVRFALISKSHGGRSSAVKVLKALIKSDTQ